MPSTGVTRCMLRFGLLISAVGRLLSATLVAGSPCALSPGPSWLTARLWK